MSTWSKADAALLLQWVNMAARLYWDGASDEAVIAALRWQMEIDLSGRR